MPHHNASQYIGTLYTVFHLWSCGSLLFESSSSGLNSLGGGGELHQIFGTRVQHVIPIWTQSDLRFCENNGSKDLKSMKEGSFGSKIKGTFIQNA